MSPAPPPSELAAAGLVACGLAGLALLGPAPAALAAATALVGLGAAAARTWAPAAAGALARGARWAPLVGLPALGGAALAGAGAETVLAGLLAGLGAHRLASRPLGADRVPAVVSTLSLVLAAARADGAAALAPIGIHGALLPVALASRAIGARGAGALAAAVGLVAAGLFAGMPRLLSAPEPGRTAFTERVELGGLDHLLDDPAVVFRARVAPPAREPVVWRGVALDRFDGRRWTAEPAPTPTSFGAARTLPAGSHVLEVEAVERGPVVFTAGRVVDLAVDGAGLVSDGLGGWRAADPARWRVVALPPLGAAAPWSREPPEALARARALPSDLDPRVAALAAEVAGEGPPTAQVARLAAFLREEYRYTRRPADAGDEAPLARFLFDAKAGHCEYFASALAVLARSRGIPARVVDGYLGGDVSARDGWLEVRRSHAHAWTEVWLDGWVPIDATPAGLASGPRSAPDLERLADGVIDYDRDAQLGALLALSRLLDSGAGVPWRGLAVLGAAGVLGVLLLRALARRTVARVLGAPPAARDVVTRLHDHARAHFAAAGLGPPPGLAPVEAATWIARRRPGPDAEALVDLAWLLYEVRLGGADARALAPRARGLFERAVRGPVPP